MKVSIILLLVALGIIGWWKYGERIPYLHHAAQKADTSKLGLETAMLAGGCFWCVEHDLRTYTGVVDAQSGYAGGEGDDPTYGDYAERGFREVVLVTYDPAIVSYGNLVDFVIRHADVTDAGGSFYDRGQQYVSAAYYDTPERRAIAEKVIADTEAKKVYDKPIVMEVVQQPKFWPAEEYHQQYAEKNPVKYGYYRNGSGRDAFIKKYWGDDTVPTPTPEITTNTTTMSTDAMGHPWQHYVKPSDDQLKQMLSPLQYKVTQKEGTEPPFQNEYDNNHEAGIYVDRLSGEPLYLSTDKFDSGTGWPSFVQPISNDAIGTTTDNYLIYSRTEVHSKIAGSHLGHVFDDGPKDRGGKRYCMNSAAMRFIPKADMEREGYGDYVSRL